MEQIKITTRDEIDSLGSAPTFEGLNLNSLDAMAKIFEKEFGFNKSKVYVLSGKDMNAAYKLTGTNAYPDDLHIVSLDFSDLWPHEKLDYIKMRRYGVRWMDDIVSNNLYRERA